MVSIRKIYVKKRIIEKRYMVTCLPSWLVIGIGPEWSRIEGFMYFD